jgi:hypothetical protein
MDQFANDRKFNSRALTLEDVRGNISLGITSVRSDPVGRSLWPSRQIYTDINNMIGEGVDPSACRRKLRTTRCSVLAPDGDISPAEPMQQTDEGRLAKATIWCSGSRVDCDNG